MTGVFAISVSPLLLAGVTAKMLDNESGKRKMAASLGDERNGSPRLKKPPSILFTKCAEE